MRTSYIYTFCLLVVLSIILSCYYIVIVGDINKRLMHEDGISISRNISRLEMLQRAQDEEHSPISGFDDDLMLRAIQVGNLTRLKNVLKKALRGEDINLLVIGGSNSAGGKLGPDEKSFDGLYFKVFAKWWNTTFGKATKSFVKEIQLTIGATGSPFFAFCYETFITDKQSLHAIIKSRRSL